MKHLCVVNPKAFQANGCLGDLIDTINDFFGRNPKLSHSVHVTRWKRDASGYVRRYAGGVSEMVRVIVFGGSGSLFEVINGVIGLPNVQVAYFPLGRENSLFISLGKNSKEAFESIPTLVFSPVASVDTILAGNHYVLSSISIGIGSLSFRLGRRLVEQFKLPLNIAYSVAGVYCAFTRSMVQRYRLEAENIAVEDDFASLYVANVPGIGGSFPAMDAKFNDGYMDLYTVKKIPKRLLFRVLLDCHKGMYTKWPQYINHYRCKKLRITSLCEMTMVLDGELFYGTKLNLEVFPSSLNFVCPPGIDNLFFEPEADEPVSPEDLDLPDGITVSDFVKSEDTP